jgi:hypothetical protein
MYVFSLSISCHSSSDMVLRYLAHHRAYEKARVLHHGVSINNLMFRRKDNKAAGVMNDWDLSAPVDLFNRIAKSLAKFRTGTFPFLAMALLTEVKEEVYHAYHHDLESFFYLLIWAGLHFHLNGFKEKDVHPEVKDWTGNMETAQREKAYLFNYSGWGPVCAAFTEECKDLAEWIDPLWLMFRNAFRKADDPMLKVGEEKHEKFFAETVTFEKISSIRCLSSYPSCIILKTYSTTYFIVARSLARFHYFMNGAKISAEMHPEVLVKLSLRSLSSYSSCIVYNLYDLYVIRLLLSLTSLLHDLMILGLPYSPSI